MMRCKRCRAQIYREFEFCRNCGRKLNFSENGIGGEYIIVLVLVGFIVIVGLILIYVGLTPDREVAEERNRVWRSNHVCTTEVRGMILGIPLLVEECTLKRVDDMPPR